MEWMLMPLRRYAEFSGRSRRKEYWLFVLGVVIVAIFLKLIEDMLGMSGAVGGAGPLSLLLVLILFIPLLAVQVRRFHDQDRSGWWVLLNIIPFGGLIVLVFMCLDGTTGPNRFGSDPKGVETDPATFA